MSDKIFTNKKSVRTNKKKQSEEGGEIEDAMEEESITVSKNLEEFEENKSKESDFLKSNELLVTSENVRETVEEKKEIKVESAEAVPLKKEEKPKKIEKVEKEEIIKNEEIIKKEEKPKKDDEKYHDKNQKCSFYKCYPWLIAIGIFVGSLIIYRKLK